MAKASARGLHRAGGASVEMETCGDRFLLRLIHGLFLSFCCGAFLRPCQAQQVPTLRTRTNLVLVPTLVESKTGEPVFNLTAKDFLVTDNGVEQKIHLDPETYQQPISIVVLVQVGRSAVREFYKYQGLPTMVNALAGDTSASRRGGGI